MANLSSVPESVQTTILEGHGADRSRWPKELAILFDDAIIARPLNLPGIGAFEFKNTEVCYHLVRRPMGPNPDLTRYLQMKTAGYRNATIEDVNPLVNAVSADGTEVTVGQDLILMCAPPHIHYGAIKAHMQRAINMTNPRTPEAKEAMMRSGNYADGRVFSETRTTMPDAGMLSEMESRATPENSVRQGTPKWDEIAKGTKEKGAK